MATLAARLLLLGTGLVLCYLIAAWIFGWFPLERIEPLTTGSRSVTLSVEGDESTFEGVVGVDGEERTVRGTGPRLVSIGEKRGAGQDFFARVRRTSGTGPFLIALLGCPGGAEPRRSAEGAEPITIRCGEPTSAAGGENAHADGLGLCSLFDKEEAYALLLEPLSGSPGPSDSVPSEREHCAWTGNEGGLLVVVRFPASQYSTDVSTYQSGSRVERLSDVGDEAVFITPNSDVSADVVRRMGAAHLLIRTGEDYLYLFLNKQEGVAELRRFAPVVAGRFQAQIQE